MIILDENKINRTDKEKLFIEDIQNKELVIKSIEDDLAFFRQLRGYNNGLDNNRLYQLDKCFNQGKDRLKYNFSNSVGYHRWNITDEELFNLKLYYNVYDRKFQYQKQFGKTAITVFIQVDELDFSLGSPAIAIAEYVKDKVDEYISGFYKSLLEIDNETKWTGQFLPEDLGIEKTIKFYNYYRNENLYKEGEFFFSEADIQRLGKYTFEILKNASEFPLDLNRIIKFISKEDKAQILVESVFNPTIDNVKNNNIDAVLDRVDFLSVCMDKLKVFSNKNVKKSYKELIDAIKESQNITLSNLLLKLDNGDFNKSILPVHSLTKEDEVILVLNNFVSEKIVSTIDESRYSFVDDYYFKIADKVLVNNVSLIIQDFQNIFFINKDKNMPFDAYNYLSIYYLNKYKSDTFYISEFDNKLVLDLFNLLSKISSKTKDKQQENNLTLLKEYYNFKFRIIKSELDTDNNFPVNVLFQK